MDVVPVYVIIQTEKQLFLSNQKKKGGTPMIGGILMSDTRRYGKPSMTDLPGELGKSVMETIMNAPKPDRRKMQEESDRMVSIILAERAREKTRNSQFFMFQYLE